VAIDGHTILLPFGRNCLLTLTSKLLCYVLCQGFHFLADTYDGFGGLAAALMEDVADDFSGKGLLTFSLTPAVFPHYVTDFHK